MQYRVSITKAIYWAASESSVERIYPKLPSRGISPLSDELSVVAGF